MTLQTQTRTRIADIQARGELHSRAYRQRLITTETLASIGVDLMDELQEVLAYDDDITAEEYQIIFNKIEKHSKKMVKAFKFIGQFIDPR